MFWHRYFTSNTETKSVRHGAVSSWISKNTVVDRANLGTTNFGPSYKMGKVAYSSKTCHFCPWKHHTQYNSPTETNNGTTSSWTEVRDGNWRCDRGNRERSTRRNSQLKLQWDLKFQKITEAGVLCGERPWHHCDQKCVSLLNLSIGTEGRRRLTQKFPHDNIYDLTTLKLWEMMEIAFIRPRNITFDRYVFFSRKQKKGETVEQI